MEAAELAHQARNGLSRYQERPDAADGAAGKAASDHCPAGWVPPPRVTVYMVHARKLLIRSTLREFWRPARVRVLYTSDQTEPEQSTPISRLRCMAFVELSRPEGDSVRKRQRRTKEALNTFDAKLVSLAADSAPATARQIFYLATTSGLEKDERSYKRVCDRLKELRLQGRVLWKHIADRTRFQRKPLTFRDMHAAVEHTRRSYRRAVWYELPCRVFVVLEKDALSGVVGDITEEYDVPLLVTRGFSSLSFIHGLAEDINVYADYGVTTYVYALGDWDPSGVKAHESFESRLIEWCPAANDNRCGFVFSRLAVTRDQIGKVAASDAADQEEHARRRLGRRRLRRTRRRSARDTPGVGSRDHRTAHPGGPHERSASS